MKKVLLALSVLWAMNVHASEVRYVPVDESVYSNLCVVAAVQGLDAARQQGAEHFAPTIRCNGKSIADFALKVVEKAEPSLPVNYKFVAANQRAESAVCALAAEQGLQALDMPRRQMENIYCNGRKLETFVKVFARR